LDFLRDQVKPIDELSSNSGKSTTQTTGGTGTG
jgi:hypothetical protein